MAKYWWPDQSEPDGLPYIRHDGQVNPEYYSIPDKKNLENMIDRVKTLSISTYRIQL
jgi:Alginate lyase